MSHKSSVKTLMYYTVCVHIVNGIGAVTISKLQSALFLTRTSELSFNIAVYRIFSQQKIYSKTVSHVTCE